MDQMHIIINEFLW